MTVIALFFPAFLSMSLYMKLQQNALCKWQMLIIKYGVYVICNTLVTQITVTYLLGISQVQEEAFKSFPFFVKYVVIALVWAIVLPFIEEILKKYIKVSISISTGKENK